MMVRRSFIHMEVKAKDGQVWMLTVVYANPHPNVRRFLWELLDDLGVGWPWLLIRYFNSVSRDEGRSLKVGASIRFQNWVRNGLIDMGYVKSQYTWRHGGNVETRKAAKLDRTLCCDDWRRLFPSAKVRHLSHRHSD